MKVTIIEMSIATPLNMQLNRLEISRGKLEIYTRFASDCGFKIMSGISACCITHMIIRYV